MRKRIIEVACCHPDECPYCIPDAYSKQRNWCHCYLVAQNVSSKLKGFPKICPLKEVEDAAT
jgi:hypothetical protein